MSDVTMAFSFSRTNRRNTKPIQLGFFRYLSSPKLKADERGPINNSVINFTNQNPLKSHPEGFVVRGEPLVIAPSVAGEMSKQLKRHVRAFIRPSTDTRPGPSDPPEAA